MKLDNIFSDRATTAFPWNKDSQNPHGRSSTRIRISNYQFSLLQPQSHLYSSSIYISTYYLYVRTYVYYFHRIGELPLVLLLLLHVNLVSLASYIPQMSFNDYSIPLFKYIR